MTTSVAKAGQRLLQDDQPFDVAVLDGIVAAAYEPRHPERATANEILMKLREKPGCWQAADQIIEKSSLPQGRYFGLMALDDAINTRWKILPEGQRTGIKNFIVNKIISLSKDEESSMRERTMIHQMNKVLVSILKQEWPHNWPSFIGDICGASKNSEILCQWFLVALPGGYRPVMAPLESFLERVGRRKFLSPLYRELAKTPGGLKRAREIYSRARPGYHPVAIGTIDGILGWKD